MLRVGTFESRNAGGTDPFCTAIAFDQQCKCQLTAPMTCSCAMGKVVCTQ